MAIEVGRPRFGLMRGPFRELARLQQEMEEMFDRLWPGWPWGELGAAWVPPVDMVDRKDEILLRADLPGLSEKDIEVTVQDNILTICGERREEREKKEDYYCCERSLGAFSRSLMLPTGVETDKVKATFKNGVLEIRLPKAKEAKARKIEIRAE